MNNNASIHLTNGLGDKLLDLVGFSVLCKYLNYKPHFKIVNNGQQPWGTPTYDTRLFEFGNDVTCLNDVDVDEAPTCNFYVNSPNPSSSLCPYKVYRFIENFLPEITFEQISNDFVVESKKIISPSQLILSHIPVGIERAYGIHLRKSDKVSDMCDIRHENTRSEFTLIINKLLEDVKNIILTETEPMFLIVSEDDQWKKEVSRMVSMMSENANKPIKILNLDYTNENNHFNYSSVLDMFCLSKCKEILQGVKYSSFSILASLLGNNKVRNYVKYCNTHDICLIHTWSSVLEINNENKNFDKVKHDACCTTKVLTIKTNINQIFTPANKRYCTQPHANNMTNSSDKMSQQNSIS